MKHLHERHFDGLSTLTVRGLSTPEQFVIGVCRCWDAFVADADHSLPWRLLGPVFAYMNVVDAFCAFEVSFRFLARAAALRPELKLGFRDPYDLSLGRDEARMLSCLASLQRGRTRDAIAVWEDVLTPQTVRTVLPPLARIAAILDVQGHRLARWRGAPFVAQVRKVVRGTRRGEEEALREANP